MFKKFCALLLLSFLLFQPLLGLAAPNRGYTGKELDPTGLNYYGQRYYDSNIGRFTQVDPVLRELPNSDKLNQVLANPQRLNSYSYANNNPVKNIDKEGEFAESAFDLIMVALDIRAVANNPSLGNALILAADAFCLAVPGLPAVAGVTRNSVKAEKIISYFKDFVKTNEGLLKLAKVYKDSTLFKQARLTFAAGETVDSLASLVSHFVNHGAEFGAKTIGEYYNAANDFLTLNKFDNKGKFLTWMEGKTDQVFYNSQTREILIKAGEEIKSFYKVDPEKYKTKFDQINNKIKKILK